MEGDDLIRHPVGHRERIHLSPAFLVRRLRMCVATGCRPTKNAMTATHQAIRHVHTDLVSRRYKPNLPWLVRRPLLVGE
jgi:hypothetical protein